MTWKSRGIDLFRQASNGRLLQPLKLKNVMSTWQNCDSRSQRPDCCEVKSLMDEATVPEGSWSENFERKNSKNNEMLVIGIVSFIIPAVLLYRTGLIKGYPETSIF